jgi:hypothetical protein
MLYHFTLGSTQLLLLIPSTLHIKHPPEIMVDVGKLHILGTISGLFSIRGIGFLLVKVH